VYTFVRNYEFYTGSVHSCKKPYGNVHYSKDY
jgi:hypothetical protein